jgi:hypothetical protein
MDPVANGAQQHGFAHAARIDDDQLLLWLVRRVLADDIQDAFEQSLAIDKFPQQLLGAERGRIPDCCF